MAKNDTPAAKAGTNQGDASKRSQEQNGGSKNSEVSIAGLEVTSTRDGFRRAGLVWGRQPTAVPLADLTKAQIAMLKGDSTLSVREVEIKPEAKSE